MRTNTMMQFARQLVSLTILLATFVTAQETPPCKYDYKLLKTVDGSLIEKVVSGKEEKINRLLSLSSVGLRGLVSSRLFPLEIVDQTGSDVVFTVQKDTTVYGQVIEADSSLSEEKPAEIYTVFETDEYGSVHCSDSVKGDALFSDIKASCRTRGTDETPFTYVRLYVRFSSDKKGGVDLPDCCYNLDGENQYYETIEYLFKLYCLQTCSGDAEQTLDPLEDMYYWQQTSEPEGGTPTIFPTTFQSAEKEEENPDNKAKEDFGRR